MSLTPGAKFRLAIEQNNPLQIVGTINPYCAMMAKKLGSPSDLLVWWRYRKCVIRIAGSRYHNIKRRFG